MEEKLADLGSATERAVLETAFGRETCSDEKGCSYFVKVQEVYPVKCGKMSQLGRTPRLTAGSYKKPSVSVSHPYTEIRYACICLQFLDGFIVYVFLVCFFSCIQLQYGHVREM